MTAFEVGKRYYYQVEYTGKFNSGKVIKVTPKFCVLENDSGDTKRKSKHLLFETEDAVKLDVIKKIDAIIQEQYFVNILELSKIFKEMLEKYPEKFV